MAPTPTLSHCSQCHSFVSALLCSPPNTSTLASALCKVLKCRPHPTTSTVYTFLSLLGSRIQLPKRLFVPDILLSLSSKYYTLPRVKAFHHLAFPLLYIKKKKNSIVKSNSSPVSKNTPHTFVSCLCSGHESHPEHHSIHSARPHLRHPCYNTFSDEERREEGQQCL